MGERTRPQRDPAAMIAALYVETNGAYFDLPGVDPWDEPRDARRYAGPYPVVAHPPCKRWGRYWSGGPSAKVRRKLGDDGGCFAHALAAVFLYGGVIEHPEASHAFRVFGLGRPLRGAGWQPSPVGGWICCVEQGHYGHRARKATWLYVRGCDRSDLPDLNWTPGSGKVRLDPGFHSAAERAAAPAMVKKQPRLSAAERLGTPAPFRDILIAMAMHCDITPERDLPPAVLAWWESQQGEVSGG